MSERGIYAFLNDIYAKCVQTCLSEFEFGLLISFSLLLTILAIAPQIPNIFYNLDRNWDAEILVC